MQLKISGLVEPKAKQHFSGPAVWTIFRTSRHLFTCKSPNECFQLNYFMCSHQVGKTAPHPQFNLKYKLRVKNTWTRVSRTGTKMRCLQTAFSLFRGLNETDKSSVQALKKKKRKKNTTFTWFTSFILDLLFLPFHPLTTSSLLL